MTADGNPLNVLVVDDCCDTCTSLQLLLRHWGYESRAAQAGQSGLELMESLRPDVVVLDIGLPDVNGLEVLRRIREGKRAGWPFVICVSGWSDEKTLDTARLAGCDVFLAKPMDPETVGSMLKSVDLLRQLCPPEPWRRAARPGY